MTEKRSIFIDNAENEWVGVKYWCFKRPLQSHGLWKLDPLPSFPVYFLTEYGKAWGLFDPTLDWFERFASWLSLFINNVYVSCLGE